VTGYVLGAAVLDLNGEAAAAVVLIGAVSDRVEARMG
jgi:hypothetical protein